jgi:hypothetical protein
VQLIVVDRLGKASVDRPPDAIQSNVNLKGEDWMDGKQNFTPQQPKTDEKRANGEASSVSAPIVSGAPIGGEIWKRAADSACREMNATMESSGLAMRGLCEMQTQWWSFLERTLRSSLDASQQLKDCTDYAAVVDHQRRFFEERVRDLVTETTEMMRITARLATSSIEPFTARRDSAKPPPRS